MNNKEIKISEHACKRFIERIAPNLASINNHSLRMKKAQTIIKELFARAAYISDNSKGILFRNHELEIDIILKARTVKTIYSTNKRKNNHGK